MHSKRHDRELAKLALKHRVESSVTDDAIHNFFQSLDCPRSLALWLLYKNKEHQQLVEMSVNPTHYSSAEAFRDAYIATEFLSKSNFLKLDVARDKAAFAKFFEYEDLCKRTNIRFKNLLLDPLYKGANVWLLNTTIRKIEMILHDYSPDELVDQANWGPGVTTLLKGEHVSAVNKFQSETGITQDLYALVRDWFPVAYPQWWNHLTLNSERGFTDVVGNTIVTVPKNSKTDRVIAIEPGINLWIQKALGSMIRRRLQRAGVNLNSQELNQQLSQRASKDDSLATVDFSSASDSISLEVVRALLPPRWFQILDATRSKIGQHSGVPLRWQKFSSMGNGYTFELESLIFYAAALSVREYIGGDGEINVFGDDVIIPKDCYDLFSSFSAFLGFKVNPKKSFSSGYFRESCGAHWYDGVDCKPIFLKERLQNVSAIYKLANRIRALAHSYCGYSGCDRRFVYGWSNLVRRVPKPLRFRTPYGYGDGGFISNFDEACPPTARDGIEGFRVRAVVATGVSQYSEGTGLLLARLKANVPRTEFVLGTLSSSRLPNGQLMKSWMLSDKAYNNMYDLRGRSKISVKEILVHTWYNLGPWV
jgi:hypothetical protein